MNIINFKGVKKCKITKLNRINLFIGKNDSCKSTILEAAYTTLKENAQPSLNKVISRRSNVYSSGRELWYDYDTKNQFAATLLFGYCALTLCAAYNEKNDAITSRLTCGVKGTLRETASSYIGRDWSFRGTSVLANLFGDLSKREQDEMNSYVNRCRLVDSSEKNDLQMVEKLLGEVKLIAKDSEFGKFLFDTYGSGMRWEFVPHPDDMDNYRVAFKEGKKRLFLNTTGDGIRSGMLIIANCILAKNTALFVEEIENYQHPESLKKLIHLLVEISEKNKLQVFVTTHERTVWGLFETEFPTLAQRNKNFQCFHVTRDKNTGIVNCKPLSKNDSNEFWMKVDRDLWGSS